MPDMESSVLLYFLLYLNWMHHIRSVIANVSLFHRWKLDIFSSMKNVACANA